MKYICNPLNINYRYQFNKDARFGDLQIYREAADPSMICFQNRYYIFASMTLGVWVSDDLAHWENHKLPDSLPLYDYAPDVRVVGDYVYFCASSNEKDCSHIRTKDILNGPYEEFPGNFPFWDPNLFCDDDGRLYFFWGCDNMDPIWGTELDPKTLLPIREKVAILDSDARHRGYERRGDDNMTTPLDEDVLTKAVEEFKKTEEYQHIPDIFKSNVRSMLSERPHIEGAWLDKFNGKYYMQYACPGAEYNIYSDATFVSNAPLGPYVPAKNNPYSYKPGGFIPGAGHGSTMVDLEQRMWHTSTMRISCNHPFERRVGIWPAGLDNDGELFCNQRFGDWPMNIETMRKNPWNDPEWFLLSCKKSVTASSYVSGNEPEKAIEENIQTWWRAASSNEGEWIQVDLGKAFDIRAIQINFADDSLNVPIPGEFHGTSMARLIDGSDLVTRWILEGSNDGEHYDLIENKWNVDTDLSHDLIVREDGIKYRYIKLTIREIPYHQIPAISGLRVFGIGTEAKPSVPEYDVVRKDGMTMEVDIHEDNALGYNILWGLEPDKLYHSYMIFNTHQRIGALVDAEKYYVRVDAFNEDGITIGTVKLI